MSTRFIRLAGLMGVVGTIVTLALIFVAVGQSPWFSWHDNALSDMGASMTPNSFNAALLLGGALYLLFAIGFLRFNGTFTRWAQLGAVFMLAGALALPLIGVFTEDAGRIHYVVAVTYYLATPLAYLLLSVDMLKRGERVPGALTLAAGLAALFMLVGVPRHRWAVPEILAALVLGAWTLSFGVKLLFESKSSAKVNKTT